jgi:nicotinamide riboside transporter PnuC
LISRKTGLIVLFVVTLAVVVVDFLLPRIPQPQAYHDFADHRSFLGIPNFGDVVSNLPFAVVGLWGLLFWVRSFKARTKAEPDRIHFLDTRERWPYLIVFVGILLTAFGSSYYHLDPSNARLVWDRLPMTIAFMSMVAAIIAERINLRAGLWLLPILVIIGMASVFQWYMSELRGAGDLRFYATVQAYSLLFLLIALLLPPRYTRSSDLAIVAGFYALAKVLETLDKPIFSLGNVVSGHTLKHLAAAAAAYWILRMLQKRRPLPGVSPVAAVT